MDCTLFAAYSSLASCVCLYNVKTVSGVENTDNLENTFHLLVSSNSFNDMLGNFISPSLLGATQEIFSGLLTTVSVFLIVS